MKHVSQTQLNRAIAVDWLKAQEKFDMTTWSELGVTGIRALTPALVCRTEGCIAGTIVHNLVATRAVEVPEFEASSREDKLDRMHEWIEKTATEFLGLTKAQAAAIFIPVNLVGRTRDSAVRVMTRLRDHGLAHW